MDSSEAAFDGKALDYDAEFTPASLDQESTTN